MLTGFSNAELNGRAMAAGADQYIEKGASPKAIIGAVRGAGSAAGL
jgi:DNA-binding NarL/FixJ family response regulator